MSAETDSIKHAVNCCDEIPGSDRPGSEEERPAPEVEIGVGETMKNWLFYLMGKLKKLLLTHHYTMFIEIITLTLS